MRKWAMAFVAMAATPAAAQEADYSRFTYGPVFADNGPVADVAVTTPIPADAQFRVAFDAARASDGVEANPTLVSAARLINMHARAGLARDATQVAVVVHGRATPDLLNARAYAARNEGAANPSAELVGLLLDSGVRIILCGQSAAGSGVDETADLLPGVEVALSAMTAHAMLQQQGYTVNPF